MSGNIFQDVLNDAGGVQNNLLGPTYPYYKNIKMPSQIGMSDKGTMKQLSSNIDGLINYVELLVSGKSKASKTGGPLGNKFFLKTGGKCIDNSTDGSNNQVDRYIYINNVPNGTIPFISSGMGVNFSDFEGLIPGSMGNLEALNPFAILQSFMSGATPPCQEITMQTINVNNHKSSESHFVTVADIKNISPCSFPKKKNPITKAKCKEAFVNGSGVSANAAPVEMPHDIVAQLYFAGLGCLGIYILHRFMEKTR
jgi:hypothetical protein